MKKTCVICGKEFEGTGRASYCNGPHTKQCEVCGKMFEWDYKNPKRCCSSKCSAILRKKSIQSSTKICEICGKEFHPKSNTQRYCEDDHYNPCPVCGKPVKILLEYDPVRCCSQECTNELRKRTCLTKFGVPVVSQNEVVRKKLSESAKSSEESRKQTVLIRWGVDNVSKNSDVKRRISETVSSEDCQMRMRKTTYERYGTQYAMQSNLGLSRYRESIQSKYGVPYFCMTDMCKSAQGDIVSSLNRMFGELLQKNNITYKFEERVEDRSYDICLPDSNILIEINPTYTHNSIGNHWGSGLDKNYHKDKTKLANDHGYRCIHIWDWDDVDKIVATLKSKKLVYARKCTIQEIDTKTANVFEDKYHLQGQVSGQKVCIGLYFNHELIQIVSFGKPRYNTKYEWELLRLCSNRSYAVVGGAERLWKYFIRTYSPKSIISYCDASKFSGDVYERLGMNLLYTTEPNKIWSKGHSYITNNLLIQRGYDQLFGTTYGKGTSNEELMIKDGWLPVYDCGQMVFEYKNP